MNIRLVHMLEQLRVQLGGKPVVIISGYRCAVCNRVVGGARQSQHPLGYYTSKLILFNLLLE